MGQNEAQTGLNKPVGHRRKLLDSSGTPISELANHQTLTATAAGRRRKPEAAETAALASQAATNQKSAAQTTAAARTVGRRRKPETSPIELVSADTAVASTPSPTAARPSRPVGSRRKLESPTPQLAATIAPSAEKPTQAAGRAHLAGTSKVANEYHLRNNTPPSKASPFIKRRLVPAAGFSALVLASVAAFVDVSSLPDTSQYKDVITAAATANVEGAATSRDLDRAPVVDGASAREEVEGTLFVAENTEVRADATRDSAVLANVKKGDTVKITGVTDGDWTQIIHKDLPRWIETSLVSEGEPRLLAHEGEISNAVCARGSGIEARLQPDTIRVYRAVCARFPEIRQYWGQANRGTHSTGHSLDIMVAGARGHEVAAFLQDRQQELGVKYLIYEQRIWNVQSSSAGWRGMADRGGITANHYDHVHVTTFGNAGQ